MPNWPEVSRRHWSSASTRYSVIEPCKRVRIGEKNFRELLRSDAVVSLITENSVGASYPMSEIGAARALRKKLIPVVIGSVPPPSVIQDIYYISESFSGKSKAAGMKRIVNQIDQQIKEIESKNVFIVHGTSEASKNELKRLLTGCGVK